jgi:hypothetical protein
MSLFPLFQILYWLSLASWFGGVLFIAVAAPVIFRTVREAKPLLPTVLSVNLENQHADLLAGSIVGNLLALLSRIQPASGVGVLLGLVGQWTLGDREGPGLLAQVILRTCLFGAAMVMVIYQWRVLWPRIEQYRTEYIEHADEPDVANPAKDQFDRLHHESVNVLLIILALLLGLILFSGNITTRSTFRSSDIPAARASK